MPVSVGNARSRCWNASSPPADAPIPTIGNAAPSACSSAKSSTAAAAAGRAGAARDDGSTLAFLAAFFLGARRALALAVMLLEENYASAQLAGAGVSQQASVPHLTTGRIGMSNATRRVATLLASIALIMAMSACQKEGPAERAGKQVDKTVDSIKDAVKK